MAAVRRAYSGKNLLNNPRPAPYSILLLVAFFQQILMGGTYPFAWYVLQQADPFAIAFIRFLIAAIIFIPIGRHYSRKPGAVPISRPDKKLIVILGVVIIIGNQTLFLYGQKFTSAAHGSLIFAITPIFVYLLAIRHLGEKWSYRKGAGILLAVIGSVIIIFERGFKLDFAFLHGDIVIVAAVIAWAIYTVYGKPLVHKYGAFRVTAYALSAGTLFYLPIGLYFTLTTDFSRVDAYGWLAILYLALITSVFGYSVWYWLLKQMEASRLTVLVNIQPIVAGILAVYLLNEQMMAFFVIGGLIILTGVTITQQT